MKDLRGVSVLNRVSLVFMFANLTSIAFSLPIMRGYFYPWACLFCFIMCYLKDRDIGIKYILLSAIFIPVFFLPTWQEMAATSAILAGSMFFTYVQNEKPDYSLILSIFKREYKFMLIYLIVVIIFPIGYKVNEYVIPYLFINIITCSLILRTVRFIEHNYHDKRINRINTAYGIFAGIAAFSISVEQIREIIFKALRFVLFAILRLAYYAVSAFIAVFGNAIDKFVRNNKGDGGMRGPDDGDMIRDNLKRKALERKTLESLYENPVLNIVLQIIIVLIIAYVVYRIMKRYWIDRTSISNDDSFVEEKESIEREKKRDSKGLFTRLGEILRPKTLEEQIRLHYAKMLRILKSKGVEIRENDTSLEINEKSSHVYEEKILDEIRGIYILIRYGGRKGDRDSSKRISDLIKREEK